MHLKTKTMNQYILVNKEPKATDDILEWGEFMKTPDRVVGKTQIGDVHISTVFLGLDHSFTNGTPILFETIIFGGEHDQFQERYSTWEEAEKGHQSACDTVNGSELLNLLKP